MAGGHGPKLFRNRRIFGNFNVSSGNSRTLPLVLNLIGKSLNVAARGETRLLPLWDVRHSCLTKGLCPSNFKGRVMGSHSNQALNSNFDRCTLFQKLSVVSKIGYT